MVLIYVSTFFIILLFNILPAFAPPTWILLAYITNKFKHENPWLIIITGVIAASLGRLILYYYTKALSSKISIIKNKRKHSKIIKNFADRNPFKVFLASFIYSLSPIPSNIIFIFSGAIELNFIPIIIGFFAGRLISYSMGVFAYSKIMSIFNVSNTFSDVITFILAIILILINWDDLIAKLGRHLKNND